MDDIVKGSTLKKIGVSLARFADSSEKAKEPQSRMVVQANGESLKVVAGDQFGTLIASLHESTQTFRAIISARDFLTNLKRVEAKENYRIVDLNLGWEVGCSLVESDSGKRVLSFQRMSKTLPRFMLPPDKTAHAMGAVRFTADEFKEWGSMMGSVPGVSRETGIAYYPIGVEGAITTKTNRVLFGATDNRVIAIRSIEGNFEVFGSMHPTFCDRVRDIGGCTMEFWDSNHVVTENDTYKAVGKFFALAPGSPVTLDRIKIPVEKIEYKTVVDRVPFMKQLREQAKFDNYDRIGLQLNDNVLEVKALNDAKHGWHVDSKLLLNVLGATSVKQVGLGFRTGRRQPINVRIPEWTIEVMPIEFWTRTEEKLPDKSLTSG